MTISDLHLDRFPPEFHADIRRAVTILKEGGVPRCMSLARWQTVASEKIPI